MQLGVSSVREHLEGGMKKVEHYNGQKLNLSAQASKIKQAIAYEQSNDAGL